MPCKKVDLASAEILVQEVGEETIVYLTRTNSSHLLNELVTSVYRRCDGRTPMAVVAESLGEESLVTILSEFQKLGLLENEVDTSRRQFLTRAAGLGLASSFILSAVVAGPAAAASGTCVQNPAACTLPPLTGGVSGRGPAGCQPCCATSGVNGSICTGGCPGNCATCVCLVRFSCSSNGTSATACSNTPVADICQAGSSDFRDLAAPSICGDGDAVNSDRSCAVAKAGARAQAGQSIYVCCQCP